jgi:signal transduction histidine kinase
VSTISIALDAVGGAFVACSRGGAILGASPAAVDLLTQIGGAPLQLPPALWAQLERAPDGEAVIWSSNGSTGRMLCCTRYPVGDDQQLLVMREMTLQHEPLAQQLQRHRARTIEMLVFLLAHDLRAPLAAIALDLDTLHGRWAEPGEDSAMRESLEDSLRATAQLRETIDALVELVRIGPPRPTDLRVAEVIDRAVALTRPLFRSSGHELAVRLDPAAPAIRASRLAVQEILLNLLVNAVESTAEPMVVELIASPAALGERPAVRIRVRDHGPGIPPEVRSQLFRPLFTTKPTGTGLGLALARDAVLAEHGALELVEVDAGACFDIVLPAPAPRRTTPDPEDG